MILSLIAIASAHKPSFGNDFTSAQSAYLVEDPNISIVVYQELTCDETELWLHFTAEEDFPLYVQLGVPVIDRLENYYPKAAVLAAGLPEPPSDLPFEVPEGMGAIVFDSEDQAQDFYEPFTQTESWIWVEEWVNVSGEGYIVGWHPEQWTGKIWLATGEVEDFEDVSISDFAYWTEAVNNFHETGKFEHPPNTEVIECLATPESEEASTKGCATTQRTSTELLFFTGILGLFFRRSRRIKEVLQ